MLNKKFIIESVDINNASVTVRYINPYGPVETGDINLEDLVEIQQVQTGNYDLEGNPLFVENKIYPPNPNKDLVLTIAIDIIDDNFISSEKLLTTIMEMYPLDSFERDIKLKKAVDNYKGNFENFVGMVLDSNDIVILKPHEEMSYSECVGEKEWIEENSDENIL